MRLRQYILVLAKPPLSTLMIVSLCGWAVMLYQGHNMGLSEHPIWFKEQGYAQVDFILSELFNRNSLMVSSGHWLMMLVAMMSPLLIGPIRHLWRSSLSRKRWLAIVSFLISYVAIWMLAGLVLMLSVRLLQLLMIDEWFAVPGIALVLLMIWQVSPWKQASLNHCHWTPRIYPFGLTFVGDCLRYGMVAGFWCIGGCWSLMLLPLTIPWAPVSFSLMAVIELILMIERYQPSRPAVWHLPNFS